MAYELINDGPATPQRIHAIIRLLAHKSEWQRQEILDLVEPSGLDAKQKAGADTLKAATNLGLVRNTNERYALESSARQLVEVDIFRQHLVSLTSQAKSDASANYRFNLFTAWYATMDEKVLQISNSELVIRFAERIPYESEDRSMNETKFNTWRTLASFLGYGWIHRSKLVPDATVRLRPLLSELLPHDDRIPFGTFLSQLETACPELDGGDLFRLAWQHDNSTQRGQRISLMVSNALRRFNSEGLIKLDRVPDAQETWKLFPASGFALQEVSHIARRDTK